MKIVDEIEMQKTTTTTTTATTTIKKQTNTKGSKENRNYSERVRAK